MVKCMKLLGNSSHSISPIQKWQLYRCCVLPIVLYSFQLWFYNKVLMAYHMKLLNKMQKRAAIWILGAFKTSPSEGIEAIVGIIPIKFYLQKLAKCSLICPFKLPENHIVRNLMDDSPRYNITSNPYAIGSLTNQQRNITKEHIINANVKSYGIFPSFNSLHQEFTPGNRLSDKFSDRFSFVLVNKKGKENDHAQELDNLVLHNSASSTALIVTDASIKNDITTSVAHIHQTNIPLIKTVHHTVFVTSLEVELFAMRCGINQACNKDNILKIIVITNSIHAAKLIFDSSLHPLQSYLAAILSELQLFFNKSQDNTIEFWECSSHLKWRFYKDIDKDSKSFNPTPIFPYKTSWDYCKKTDSDDVIKQWKMQFQASDRKGNNFMDLLDDDSNVIEPSYIKGGAWLQVFGHSNSLCTQATRVITNHTPIGEFCLRFFPKRKLQVPIQ